MSPTSTSSVVPPARPSSRSRWPGTTCRALPKADHAAPMLVNDLDLLLIGPNGEVVRPLVLPAATQFDCDNVTAGTQTGTCAPGADPGPWPTAATGAGSINAAQGTDRLNNLEQVVVANPAPGLWRARVSVLNTDASIRLPLGGTQSYSIAGVGDERADLSITKSEIAGSRDGRQRAVLHDHRHKRRPGSGHRCGRGRQAPARGHLSVRRRRVRLRRRAPPVDLRARRHPARCEQDHPHQDPGQIRHGRG